MSTERKIQERVRRFGENINCQNCKVTINIREARFNYLGKPVELCSTCENTLRQCSQCGEIKVLERFPWNRYQCYSCQRERKIKNHAKQGLDFQKIQSTKRTAKKRIAVYGEKLICDKCEDEKHIMLFEFVHSKPTGLCLDCAVTFRKCNTCQEIKLRSSFKKKRYKCKNCTHKETSVLLNDEYTASKYGKYHECRLCNKVKPFKDMYVYPNSHYMSGFCIDCQSLNTHKLCKKCGDVKPLDCFYKNVGIKSGVSTYCRECRKTICRERYHTRNGREKGLIKVHKRRDKYKHYTNNLTSHEWQTLLSFSGRRCMKCGVKLARVGATKKNFPSRDHVYADSEGLIDGLTLRNTQVLCRSCNSTKGDKDFTDYRPLWLREWIYEEYTKRGISPEELQETHNLLFSGVFNSAIFKGIDC